MRLTFSARRPTRRRARGFALVEVLVAMAIVVSIGTLSYLTLSGRSDRARVEADAAGIALFLQQTRMRALEQGQPVEIVLKADEGILAAGATRHPLPEGVILSPTAARIVMRPSGESNGLVLEIARGDARAGITLDWLTGRVVVE